MKDIETIKLALAYTLIDTLPTSKYDIILDLLQGMTPKECTEKYNVTRQYISKVKKSDHYIKAKSSLETLPQLKQVLK